MRVVSGELRGRRLKTPEGYDVRPTTDIVKESIFNIIQFDIPGRKVLDLFAGTGQLGIECLSRGAASAVFVDNDRRSAALVKDNLRSCGLTAEVLVTDALSYLERCGKYDIIFVDPPYDSEMYAKVLENINLFDILNDGGIIICESRKEKVLPEMRSPYHLKKTYSYGKIKLSIFSKSV